MLVGTRFELLKDVLDLDGVLERVGGNNELLALILEKFRQSYGDVPERIRAVLFQGDRQEALMRVHALAGAAANMGAVEVAAAAAALERFLRQDVDNDCNPCLDNLEIALITLMRVLDEFAQTDKNGA